MKRIALLAAVGAALMALPSSAAAQTSTCRDVVDVQNNAPGFYACIDVSGAGGEVQIAIEGSCSYVNAWNTNPLTPGYAGICPEATPDPACDGIDDGSGANEGGCFYVKPTDLVINNAVTAMLICGNNNGDDPEFTTRDGCSIPDD